jgi:hypothetical protein
LSAAGERRGDAKCAAPREVPPPKKKKILPNRHRHCYLLRRAIVDGACASLVERVHVLPLDRDLL